MRKVLGVRPAAMRVTRWVALGQLIYALGIGERAAFSSSTYKRKKDDVHRPICCAKCMEHFMQMPLPRHSRSWKSQGHCLLMLRCHTTNKYESQNTLHLRHGQTQLESSPFCQQQVDGRTPLPVHSSRLLKQSPKPYQAYHFLHGIHEGKYAAELDSGHYEISWGWRCWLTNVDFTCMLPL